MFSYVNNVFTYKFKPQEATGSSAWQAIDRVDRAAHLSAVAASRQDAFGVREGWPA
jgi:hypothetical protein